MAVELRYQAFLLQLDIEEGGDRQTTTSESLAKRGSRHQTHRRVAHFIREEVDTHGTYIKLSQFMDETLFT